MLEIKPKDIEKILIYDPEVTPSEATNSTQYVDYQGDATFMEKSEYIGSRLSRTILELDHSIRVVLKNGQEWQFRHCGEGEFLVSYKGNRFYIKNQQLYADIIK